MSNELERDRSPPTLPKELTAILDGRPIAILFFHLTTAEAASSILRAGFRDVTWSFGQDVEVRGVFVSDVPLDINEGHSGDTLLTIELTCAPGEIADFELYEEGGSDLKGYREWVMPAAILNKGVVRIREGAD